MSDARGALVSHLHAIYDLDLSRLEGMARLGRHSQRATAILALLVAAAERDARIKLGWVRHEGLGPAKARAQAWLVTRGLRVATAALRQASAQSVAYRVELDKQFVIPARQLRTRRRPDRGEGFDILGGLQ